MAQLTISSPKLSRRHLFAGALALLASGLIAAVIIAQLQATSGRLPAAVLKQALFPLYSPRSLPGGYHLDEDSFDITNDAVVFSAVNDDGSRVAFSEQPAPQSFSIINFQQHTLQQARSLVGTPYPSVMGTAGEGTKVVSVQAGPTWVLITARTKPAEAALEPIARGLRPQSDTK